MIAVLLLLTSTAFAADSFDEAAYYAQSCAMCHGATGQGDGAAAAALTPKPANFASADFWSRSDDTVKKAIKEGGAAVGKSPTMAPIGAGLSDVQLSELVAYLKTLKK